MGSLASVIAPIASVGKLFVSNSERAQNIKALELQNKQLAQNAALQKQSNLLTYQQQETDRLARLRKNLATQRAQFGGQGIGDATGSSEAVLQGLNETSDIERQKNESQLSTANTRIDSNLKSQQQLNLLQKQQLKQKAALGFLTDIWG